MTSREKHFNIRVTLARGLGTGIATGAAAAVVNIITLPGLVLFSTALGAAGGAGGAILGDYFGYLFDEMWLSHRIGTSLLFNFVVSAILSSVLYFLALGVFMSAVAEPAVPLLAISAFSGFVASVSACLWESLFKPNLP